MDFEFSEDAIMLRDMLRRFVDDEAKLLESQYFSTGTLEAKDCARLRTVIEQLGLWNITVPEKFGGGGLDMVTTCLMEEELGKTFIPLEIGDVPPLLYACQGDQVRNYLAPALAGKKHPFLAAREPGAFRPEEWTTTATPEGTTYLLNGKKLLSAMPSDRDFLVVLAKAPAGISAFMLDPTLDGIKLHKNGGVMLELEHCCAGAGSLLGESGQALRLGIDDAPRACIQLSARYVGLAERMLHMSVEYAKTWVSLGGEIGSRPAIQRMLTETQVQINATRWLIYHAAWQADQKLPTRPEAAEVRLAAGEMLARTTELVTMIYGGPGPSPEIDIHRYIQSAVPMEALELGLECARTLLAAQMLGVSKEG